MIQIFDPTEARDTALARLFANTRTDPDTGCRLWTKGKNRGGYGVKALEKYMRIIPSITEHIKEHGKTLGVRLNFLAHNLVCILMGRQIPEHCEVHHLCFDTSCIAPEHLTIMPKFLHRAIHRKLRKRRKSKD